VEEGGRRRGAGGDDRRRKEKETEKEKEKGEGERREERRTGGASHPDTPTIMPSTPTSGRVQGRPNSPPKFQPAKQASFPLPPFRLLPPKSRSLPPWSVPSRQGRAGAGTPYTDRYIHINIYTVHRYVQEQVPIYDLLHLCIHT
jgi:hypothetical protein